MLVLLPWLQVIGVYAWLPLCGPRGAVLRARRAGAAALTRRDVRLPGWPLWVAAAWVADGGAARRWCRSAGFPWGRLAFAVVDTPVAPLLAVRRRHRRRRSCVALVGAAARLRRSWPRRERAGGPWPAGGRPLALAWPRRRALAGRPRPADPRIARSRRSRATCRARGWTAFAERRAVPDNHVAGHPASSPPASTPGRRREPDLVVWPENSTDIDPFADPRRRADDRRRRRARSGCRILVGAVVDGPGRPRPVQPGHRLGPGSGRGATGTSSATRCRSASTSRCAALLAPASAGSNQIPRDMVRGHPLRRLQRRAGARSATLICFEVAYDDAGPRPGRPTARTLLVVQTNNATFIHTGQIEQQFAIIAAAGDRDRPLRRGRRHQRHLRGHRPRRPRGRSGPRARGQRCSAAGRADRTPSPRPSGSGPGRSARCCG